MVRPLRGERPELLELTEADDGLPTVTALCDALRLGRALLFAEGACEVLPLPNSAFNQENDEKS